MIIKNDSLDLDQILKNSIINKHEFEEDKIVDELDKFSDSNNDKAGQDKFKKLWFKEQRRAKRFLGQDTLKKNLEKSHPGVIDYEKSVRDSYVQFQDGKETD